MTLELSASALAAALPALQPPSGVQAGYGMSLTDLSGFNDALRAAQARGGAGELRAQNTNRIGPAVEALVQPLEHINGEAADLRVAADAAAAAGQQMTPGEMVMLTVRCQEFMFHCQLTSNIANRTSDGLQQLFRQQS